MSLRDVDLATDLIPIGQFRSSTAKVLQGMADEGRTLVITQNGKAAAVVMSPESYDALQYERRLVAEIAQGLADADAGRVHSTADVRKALRKRRATKR